MLHLSKDAQAIQYKETTTVLEPSLWLASNMLARAVSRCIVATDSMWNVTESSYKIPPLMLLVY
jgi:hypothetical protein